MLCLRLARQPGGPRAWALIVVGTVLLVRHLGVALPDTFIWPALCVAFGLGIVVWRVQPAAGLDRTVAVRIAAGTILLALGIGVIRGNQPVAVRGT